MQHVFIKRAFLAIILMFAFTFPAMAEPMTEETGKELVKEVRMLREILEGVIKGAGAEPPPQPPAKATVSVDGFHTLGSDNAPITLVEFTDYQCPFCKRFYDNAYVQIKKNYIDTGKVRFVSRNLPLPFHNNAVIAAQAVMCAGDQDLYWSMREIVFKNTGALAKKDLIGYAKGMSMKMKKFKNCLDKNTYQEKIKSDATEANSIGIRGTPSFVIGKTTKGKMEGEVIRGAVPYAEFDAKIKELLSAN